MNLLDLYSKPKDQQFTKEELAFLKKNVDTSRWKVLYCLFMKNSPKGKYVGWFVDYMAWNPRDIKPEFYGMNVIASRPLNEKEIMWELQNYGSHNRRFFGYWVKSVLWVIDMDRQYGVDTPQEFIDICNEKGYNSGLDETFKYQLT